MVSDTQKGLTSASLTVGRPPPGVVCNMNCKVYKEVLYKQDQIMKPVGFEAESKKSNEHFMKVHKHLAALL